MATDTQKLISEIYRIVDSSQQNVMIYVPWFYSTDPSSWVNLLLEKLQSAAVRGIKVDVLLRPDRRNAETTRLLTRSGVNVALSKDLHVKLVANESEVLSTSANFTDRTVDQLEVFVIERLGASGIMQTITELKRSMSETARPEEVVFFLNELLAPLSKQVESKVVGLDLIGEGTNLMTLFGDDWVKLSEQSRRILDSGQRIHAFLMEEERRSPSQDFSPAILQYARALEAEIHDKIFIAFKMSDLANLHVGDMKQSEARTQLQSYLSGGRSLTLGEMSRIFRDLWREQSDPFKDFVLERLRDPIGFFDAHKFPSRLAKFVQKYRNRAAHPSILTGKDCKECREYLLLEPIRLLVYFVSQLKDS